MRTMRITIAWLWLVSLTAGYPQAGGTVEGNLVNLTDPSIVARAVELDVVELGQGMSIIKSAKTDSAGKFRIEGLPQDQPLMIRANYKTANYYAPVSFDAEGKARAKIEVYEPVSSMKDIEVEGIRMAFQMAGDQLKSLESITFNNKTRPPRTFSSPEGSFRFSKAPGILETPMIRVTAPGSSMPVVQAALESPDGKSYYSQYPLRPGVTTFEAQQSLPYTNRSYTFRKKFYLDSGPVDIGVIPKDMVLSGQDLSKIQEDAQGNFAVYRSTAIKAGSEYAWTLSGGTAPPEPASSEAAGESAVEARSGIIGRNVLVIGPLLLMGFITVLWYGFNRAKAGPPNSWDTRARQLRERREELLGQIAALDQRYESKALDRQEYLRQREELKRRLRRITLLIKKR